MVFQELRQPGKRHNACPYRQAGTYGGSYCQGGTHGLSDLGLPRGNPGPIGNPTSQGDSGSGSYAQTHCHGGRKFQWFRRMPALPGDAYAKAKRHNKSDQSSGCDP